MHPIKWLLIQRNGMYCMLCGKHCEPFDIQMHHIKPKWVCKKEHGVIDNTYSNVSLVCTNCHCYIHSFDYRSKEYQDLMMQIESHKMP